LLTRRSHVTDHKLQGMTLLIAVGIALVVAVLVVRVSGDG
jgi:hypothetical protein